MRVDNPGELEQVPENIVAPTGGVVDMDVEALGDLHLHENNDAAIGEEGRELHVDNPGELQQVHAHIVAPPAESIFDTAPTLWATYISVSVETQLKILLSLDGFLRAYVTSGDGFLGNVFESIAGSMRTVTTLKFIFGSDAAQVSHKSKDRGAEHMTTMVLLWINLQEDLIKSESYVLLCGLCNLNDKTPLFVQDFLESQLAYLRGNLHNKIFDIDVKDSSGNVLCTQYFRIEMLEHFKLYDTMLYRSINGTTSGFQSKFLVHNNMSKLQCYAVGRVAVDLLREQHIQRTNAINVLLKKTLLRGALSSFVRWFSRGRLNKLEFTPTRNETFINSRRSLQFCHNKSKSLITLASIPVADMPTGLVDKAPNQGIHDQEELNPRHIPVPHLHSLGSLSTHFLEALLLVYYILLDKYPSLNLSKDSGSNFSNHFAALSNGFGFGFTDLKKIKGKYSATVGSHAGNKIAIILFSNWKEIIPLQYRVDSEGTCLPVEFQNVATCFQLIFKLLQQIFWMLHERDYEESLKNVGMLHLSLTLYMKSFLSIMGPYRGKPYDWTVVMGMRFFIDEAARLKLTPFRLMAEYGIETFHSLLLDLFHGGSNQTTSSSPKGSQATAMKSLVVSRIMRMFFDASQQLFAKRVKESKVNRKKDEARRNPMLLPYIKECNDFSKGIITPAFDDSNTFGLLDEMAWIFLCEKKHDNNDIAKQLAEEFATFLEFERIDANFNARNWEEIILKFKDMLSRQKLVSTTKEMDWNSERERQFRKIISVIKNSKRHQKEKHKSDPPADEVVQEGTTNTAITSNVSAGESNGAEGDHGNSNTATDSNDFAGLGASIRADADVDGDAYAEDDAYESCISSSYRLVNICNALGDIAENDVEYSDDILTAIIQTTNKAQANKVDKINLLVDSSAFAFGETTSVSCSVAMREQLFKRSKRGDSGDIVLGFEFMNSQSITLAFTYEDATQQSPKKEREVVTTLMRNIESFTIIGINKQAKDCEYQAVAISFTFYCHADGLETFSGNKKISDRCYSAGRGPECRLVPSDNEISKIGPRKAKEWRMFLRGNKRSHQQLQQTTDVLKLLTGDLDTNEYPVSIREKLIFQEMVLTEPALKEFTVNFIQDTSAMETTSAMAPTFVMEGFNSQQELLSSTATGESTAGTGIPIVDNASTTTEICESIMKIQTIWVAATESERTVLFSTSCYQCSEKVYSSCRGTCLYSHLANEQSSSSSSSSSSSQVVLGQQHTLCGSNNTLPSAESDGLVDIGDEIVLNA